MKKTKFFALLLAMLMLLSSLTFTVSADIESTRQLLMETIQEAESAYPPPGSNPVNETVQHLSDTIKNAYLALEDENLTESQLMEHVYGLKAAILNITYLDLDNSRLWEAMVLANSLNKDDYTTESYEKMKAYANDYLTLHYAQSQKEIDDATARLCQAILDLDPIGDATVPTIDDAIYSPEMERFYNAYYAAEIELQVVGGNPSSSSYAALVQAYEKASAIIDSGEYISPNGYLALAIELEEAVENLEYLSWNTDELQETLENLSYVYDEINSGKYLDDKYLENYEFVGYEARLILYYGQSQEEVDNAVIDLKEAYRRLIPANGIKAELEEEVKHTEENILPDENLYTKESFEKVVLMNRHASELLANGAQEGALLQAIYDLRDAKDSLALKSDNPYDTEPDVSETTIATEATVATDATEVTETSAVSTEPAETTAIPESSAVTEPVEETTAEPTSEVITSSADEEPVESSTATEAATTNEATVDEIIYMVGDTDGNFKVNIKDATVIQKYLAKLVDFSKAELWASDSNEDGKVNIKDATEIQKYLANLPANQYIGTMVTPATVDEDIPVSSTTASTEPSETVSNATTDVATKDEETTVATEPETTVVTEPYDATEASTATSAADTTEATEATTETEEVTTEEITTVATTTEVIESEPITIFFRDQYNWGNIHIYYWSENTQFLQWPGVAMEPVHEDAEGIIYKAVIPAEATGIVFNSQAVEETRQTVDVYGFENGDGFYPTVLEDNSWDVEPLFYNKDFAIDFRTVGDERIYEGLSNEEDSVYLVRNDTDKVYEDLFDCEFPEIDTEDLAKRGKAAIVIMTFIGSGNSSLCIDGVSVDGNLITVKGIIRTPLMGTPDMNYRFVTIEVNLDDVENVDSCYYYSTKDYYMIPLPEMQ